MGALSVNGREVDRLRATTHFGRHLLYWHIENTSCGLPMNVTSHAKGGEKRDVLRQMCQEPQFNLQIIRTKHHPALGGNERTADFPPKLTTNWNVLQIRVTR